MNDIQKYCYEIAEKLFDKMGRPAGGELFVQEIAKGLERVFDDNDFIIQRNPLVNLGITTLRERMINIENIDDIAIHIENTIRLRLLKANNKLLLEVICPENLSVRKQYFSKNNMVTCV